MKLVIILRVSLLLIILCFSASCASSSRPVYKSSVPEHCHFRPHQKKQDPRKAKKTETPPSRSTPIGGNFKVRN